MTAFYIALVIGTIIAVAYITLAYQELQRTRRTRDIVTDTTSEHDFDEQGKGFTWVALGGVVISTTLLVLISHAAWAWYILPVLSLGSALAVVLAFLVDRESTA